MDPIQENPKESNQPLNLSNFSLQNNDKLIVQESDTKSKQRKFKDGNPNQEIQSEQYEVNKMPIRANWLISSPRREYEIIMTQAFIYLFSEKDYKLSIKSKFPAKMQIKLKETMNFIKSSEYKDEIKKQLKERWKKHRRLSRFDEEVSKKEIFNKRPITYN
jgi:hypothetical protein